MTEKIFMRNKKILYIIGAGVSASISSDTVPTMNNFFEKAIKMLDADNKVFLITFAFAEEARAFSPNPDVENLGIKLGVINRLHEKIDHRKKDHRESDIVEEELNEYIVNYKKAFMADKLRMHANLEDVFSKLESEKERKDAADQTYERLQFVINSLFYRLDRDLNDKFKDAIHHDFSDLIANLEGVDQTFISFNYDLWLEKALHAKGIWHPPDGHGYIFKYYSPPISDEWNKSGKVIEPKSFNGHIGKSKVKVLKPHGSLSWRFGKGHDNGIIILEDDDENSCVAYNPTWYYPPSEFSKKVELKIFPLIVPPAPNKIRKHPLFWKTDKDILIALKEADTVVIIGWSMPETDQYFRQMVSWALNNREEPIKKLLVCDRQPSIQSLIPKFEAIFRPIETKTYDEGFSRNFVDFLKEKI